MLACMGGHVDTARLLIDSGADVNAKRTSDGVTVLIAACLGGHVDTAKLLVDRGASVSPLTLMVAQVAGKTEVVQYLDSLVLCDNCLKTSSNMKRCKGCNIAKYCSRDCQANDWKVRHKAQCNKPNAI